MSDYDEKLRKKVLTVIEAAKLNGISHNEIRLETAGSNPHVRVSVPYFVLEKMLARSPNTSEGE